MKTKLPKFVWLLSVAFLLLMLSDAYLLPTKKIADKIDHFEVISSGDLKSHWRTPILFTQSGLKLMLPERNVYNYGDTSKLTIVKSFIFGTNLGIEINADGNCIILVPASLAEQRVLNFVVYYCFSIAF